MTETAATAWPQSSDRLGHKSFSHWSGWDYVAGMAFMVIGALALSEPKLASLASSFYLGVTLCVAGAFTLAGGIAGIGHRGGFLTICLGIFSIVAALLVLFNPIAGAISLTRVMGVWFIISGTFELATGSSIPFGRRWLSFLGIINIALGAWVLTMTRSQVFHFLGYLVGISLVLRGLWSLLFTADLHRERHRVRPRL